MLVHSNIFQPRNDWAVITFRCKRNSYNTPFYTKVAKIIKDETGIDPLTLRIYQGRGEVVSRQLFAVMMRKHTKQTLESIGEIIGKDHATIWHSARAIQNLYDTDKDFRKSYDKINLQVSNLTNK